MTAYINEAELRQMLTMQGTTFADYDIDRAIAVTNPAINTLAKRKFDKLTPDDETEVRFFRPQSGEKCHIDDLVELVALTSDQNGDMDFEHTWTEDHDFVLGPLNADTDGWPFTWLEIIPLNATQGFPYWSPKSMRVEGRWGWAAVPEDVIGAAYLLAARLIKRWRQAPLAVVTVGTDVGSAIRVGRNDPDIMNLLEDYRREKVV